MIPRRVQPKRSAGIKRKSRSAKDFRRIYGSKQRVEFVKSLPCAACHAVGYSENAHVAPASEKGTGYKAGFLWIVPLCGDLPGDYGCHTMRDERRGEFDARFPDFDPVRAAAETEQMWQSYTNGEK